MNQFLSVFRRVILIGVQFERHIPESIGDLANRKYSHSVPTKSRPKHLDFDFPSPANFQSSHPSENHRNSVHRICCLDFRCYHARCSCIFVWVGLMKTLISAVAGCAYIISPVQPAERLCELRGIFGGSASGSLLSSIKGSITFSSSKICQLL